MRVYRPCLKVETLPSWVSYACSDLRLMEHRYSKQMFQLESLWQLLNWHLCPWSINVCPEHCIPNMEICSSCHYLTVIIDSCMIHLHPWYSLVPSPYGRRETFLSSHTVWVRGLPLVILMRWTLFAYIKQFYQSHQPWLHQYWEQSLLWGSGLVISQVTTAS